MDTGKQTILVVDDEPDVLASVRDLLRRDYRVLGATRAAEGMNIVEREPVAVVMTDQRMPEMTGVELLLRVRGSQPDAVRLLFTGYADLRAVIDAINQGHVYRYITKPWDPDELSSVIREAVELHDLVLERRRLLAELQEKNEELERANRALRRSDELKTHFIRIASHELRTPLTVLVGMSELASSAMATGQKLERWMPHIQRASDRLRYLVDQLVTMMIAGEYDRPLLREEVGLAALLGEAADDVRPFVERRGQTLALDLPDDLGRVRVDAGKIRDSVHHLLLNAVKFTPDGGHLGLAAQRGAGGEAIIHVRDDGVGIEAVHLERLFTPFFTGEDSRHHTSGRFEFGARGLGLGLSEVKAFVEMHGGTVEVASTAGRGSMFTITLPAC